MPLVSCVCSLTCCHRCTCALHRLQHVQDSSVQGHKRRLESCVSAEDCNHSITETRQVELNDNQYSGGSSSSPGGRTHGNGCSAVTLWQIRSQFFRSLCKLWNRLQAGVRTDTAHPLPAFLIKGPLFNTNFPSNELPTAPAPLPSPSSSCSSSSSHTDHRCTISLAPAPPRPSQIIGDRIAKQVPSAQVASVRYSVSKGNK